MDTRTEPRLRKWLLPVLGDWLLVALLFTPVTLWPSWWVVALTLVGVGVVQHRLSIMGHEGAHRLACRSATLNDFLAGLLCFWPLGSGLYAYRKFHFAHHRHLGTVHDPELFLKKRRYDLPTSGPRLAGRFLLDLCGLAIKEVAEFIAYMKPEQVSDVLGPVLVWGVAGLVCFWLGYWQALLWPAALFTSFWGVFRLRIYTEHVGTAGTHRVRLARWQRLLFAPHNTWLHWEHHRWPAVPCWGLAGLREQTPLPRPQDFEEVLAFYRLGGRR